MSHHVAIKGFKAWDSSKCYRGSEQETKHQPCSAAVVQCCLAEHW